MAVHMERSGISSSMDKDPITNHPPEQSEPRQADFLLLDTRLLKRVEGLVQKVGRDSQAFHQTRRPFTRLQDILEPIQAERAPFHPSHCQATGCAHELGERFYRRADGYVLCADCFAHVKQNE